MNILILGSGVVGANLANKLSEQGKSVFLLDDDSAELKKLSERYDIKTIFDDPLNPTFYSNFKTKIDYFIAVTRSDEKNIITCKFAKEFLKVLEKIETKTLSKKRKYLKVLEKLELVDGKRKISIEPNKSSLEVDFQLDYKNDIIGKQKNVVDFQFDNLNHQYTKRIICFFEKS